MASDPTTRTLVLLPGLDGAGELFAPFIDALPPAFKVIPVEFPRDRLLAYPEFVGLVCSSPPASEPFALVAESFSSPIAIKVAAKKLSHLKALILCAGFASSPVHQWARRLVPLLGRPLRRVHLPSFFLRRWLVGKDAPDSLMNALRNAVASVRPEVLHSRLEMTAACDARAELAQIGVPILYLQADRDRVVPPRCLEEIRRIKPETLVSRVAGPHLLLQREPRVTAQIIADFVEKLNLDWPSRAR